MQHWSPSSWSQFTCSHSIEYPDPQLQNQILQTLTASPPLVRLDAIQRLRMHLSQAEHQQVFLLQGGDCAESFSDCTTESIQKKLETMQKMSELLAKYLKKPTIQIGRIAGQFAKARSEKNETRDRVTLPSYRGDLINGPEFTPEARTPDPGRLLEGYRKSKQTLEIVARYHNLSYDFFTSHEALHLPYEQALTRQDQATRQWYLSSTHLPWIGVRTNFLNSAHLEFVRGIINPVGIKIGPQATPDWLYTVLSQLNPERQSGRVLLITRLGTHILDRILQPLIQLVRKERFPVTWSCDPMHGNTQMTSLGLKTRKIEMILEELKMTLELHQQEQSHLSALHLELTGESVTECIGGAEGFKDHHLPQAYRSLVDPRLNHKQSLEIALEFALMHTKLSNRID
jgi:3-deoxy-7-phosphoheptulonate synthase